MKTVREEIFVWLSLVTVLLLWAAVLYLSGHGFKIDLEAIGKLPEVITLYLIASLIFKKWLWRISVFQGWLIRYPDLTGTWAGTLKSTWVNPQTNEPTPSIPVLVVIKQTFDSISCSIFTAESESYSTAAQINGDDDSGVQRLSYNYVNTPRLPHRVHSEIHHGAAILKMVRTPEIKLEGEYWTDRKTTGEISVNFRSKHLAQSFSNLTN